jgi:hypothetical protein
MQFDLFEPREPIPVSSSTNALQDEPEHDP